MLRAVVATLLVAAATGESQTAWEAQMGFLDKFKDFVKSTEKEYATVKEMLYRMEVYAQNLVRLVEMQKQDQSATYSHTAVLMDMTPEEFNARNTLKVPENLDSLLRAEAVDTSSIPSSFDWREHGAVQQIKDQAQCGSCWAFSTVANIESATVVQGKGKLLSLSEQQLVDCDKATGDMGCNGGLPVNAYKDMIENKFGLDLEKDYGYHARVGACKSKSLKQYGFINSYKILPTDESQIAAGLVKYGVLSIGINAGPMQMYSSGIADPWFCNPRGLDHAVNIVGYGEESGKKFWRIRNSWGTVWGEKGYYRIVRGVGRCGLNRMVATAIINPALEQPSTQYV